ncbi:unnamed protein product [Chondrus crispus]|uniref:Uncharacterized protein n=1 Tax=Chondrus crispus TaxID=2769 RepID=R7QGD6_CHOCR|nr:unnamed protein product [Chondrus crispus]CDF37149.1 unnamed protein product [Chondrus crispus]|eukprot:XP_005716968.1 unnamed protein product [Chondrus crispus]
MPFINSYPSDCFNHNSANSPRTEEGHLSPTIHIQRAQPVLVVSVSSSVIRHRSFSYAAESQAPIFLNVDSGVPSPRVLLYVSRPSPDTSLSMAYTPLASRVTYLSSPSITAAAEANISKGMITRLSPLRRKLRSIPTYTKQVNTMAPPSAPIVMLVLLEIRVHSLIVYTCLSHASCLIPICDSEAAIHATSASLLGSTSSSPNAIAYLTNGITCNPAVENVSSVQLATPLSSPSPTLP